ncbi:MAG TPA: helix-turn-helix domain-containing protein [Nocardioides sp.]|jgi:hypothetical protein
MSRADAGASSLEGFLAAHRSARVPHLTERVVNAIIENNPGYRAVPVVPLEDLRRSCHDNIVRLLELLALAVHNGEPPPVDDTLYDAARETGRRRADQGLPLADVLRSFRMGGALIWEDLIGEARAADLLDADGLRVVGSKLWQVVDETSAQVAAAYHSTELRLVRADEQRRAMLWEGLLSGRATERAFALEASRILDLAIDGPLAIAAVDQAASIDTFPDGIVDRLRARGVESTWQRRADCQVGFLQLPTADLGPTLAALRDWPGVAVGLSSVASGLAHTDVAFREALIALRSMASDRPAVAAYEQHLPDALLLGSPEVADRLVRDWLGPVLALPTQEQLALLETLETWVACAGSASRTAERVPCHRNTVINRVRRAAELTGKRLGEDSPPIELALALRAWRLNLRR